MTPQPGQPPLWRTLFGFWLEDNRGLLGLALALAVLGAIWLAIRPEFPTTQVSGVVLGPALLAQGKSTVAGVEVLAAGRRFKVAVPLRYACDAGDRIMLVKGSVRWGHVYSLANLPAPCRKSGPS